MKKVLLTTATLLLAITLLAQDDVKRFTPTSLSIMPFGMIESGSIVTLEDFKTLAPNSTLLPQDLTGYNTNFGYSNTGSFGNSILLGFKFGKKDGSDYRPNPILRLGISYYFNQSLSMGTFKEDRIAYDTLTSSKTGEIIPVDSIFNSRYQMDYNSHQLRLDASVIFRTDPTAKLNFYAGIGATFGASVSSQTEISHHQFSYISSEDINTRNLYISNGYDPNYEKETIANKTNLSYSAYIPLGIDFRVSNKSPFWKQVHFFYEMRTSLNMVSIPELSTYTTVGWQHGLGLKVQWN